MPFVNGGPLKQGGKCCLLNAAWLCIAGKSATSCLGRGRTPAVQSIQHRLCCCSQFALRMAQPQKHCYLRLCFCFCAQPCTTFKSMAHSSRGCHRPTGPTMPSSGSLQKSTKPARTASISRAAQHAVKQQKQQHAQPWLLSLPGKTAPSICWLRRQRQCW